MWPWEHLVVAYVCYSLLVHVTWRRPPTTRETIAVAVGSQLPDLIDKPLAWTFGITDTGYAIGHSIVVVPFVCLAVFAITARFRDGRFLTGAFSLAYGSHLVTDVLNPMRMGRDPELRVILWPLESPPTDDHGGFLDHFVIYFVRYTNQLLSGGLSGALLAQLWVVVAVVALWLYDGAPIASDCVRIVRSRLR
ncbi:metal-dependent hydrolase [Natronolimnobius baerhuensis]|uniref:Metal-dependent hydrolase n=1 Tax=Natronolimnobius baerhuensis TaxID=253108 RepID=A0A202E775_9EURY|nr:metal-dependent hydrolase [Natronolimnobius baerhuensis]OVE84111.1 metal-dependent hydrolase [Natronolimnobius baerhuensis]